MRREWLENLAESERRSTNNWFMVTYIVINSNGLFEYKIQYKVEHTRQFSSRQMNMTQIQDFC